MPREAFDAALAAEIDRSAPRLIALAGFMSILTPGSPRVTPSGCSISTRRCCPRFRAAHARAALAAGVGARLHRPLRDRGARPRADRGAGGCRCSPTRRYVAAARVLSRSTWSILARCAGSSTVGSTFAMVVAPGKAAMRNWFCPSLASPGASGAAEKPAACARRDQYELMRNGAPWPRWSSVSSTPTAAIAHGNLERRWCWGGQSASAREA